ncbi:MAG: flagellar filament capping protein FliD [Terracidiphilus sp.]
MGTVGLNFGSPTSGAGFDVSSTVAEIVGNLQNVETPWKSQLTTLESEDTAISSLGTLYSNLSNDMSSLTDFQGILAEKTGSSSNTNVLELTAASSSATAGTHTVMVNTLAQTSSGYMAPIANASDTLSGSITLQVGSGTAQTITLDSSDNTLAGLAAAINGSGLGITANVLTDASGSRLSLVSGTSGADGNISVSANSVTDTSTSYSTTLTYSDPNGYTDSTADSGTLGEAAGENDTLSGTVTIGVGAGTPQIFTLDSSDDTLSTLADAINNAALGATASVIQNGDGTYSLSLQSQTDGSAGALTVTSSVADSTMGYTAAVTGANASLTVDGVNLTSASNTVDNLIPGVTFQLLATSSDPVQVVIGNDNSGVESTVNQFVSDYNALMSAVNAQEGNDSSGNPEPLFGSPTLSLLQQQLLSGLNMESPNGYLDAITNSTDELSGSITIQVGASGTPQTIDVPGSPDDTLSGLAAAINSASIGVTANVVTNSSGSQLEFVSNTVGSNGVLTVTSAITDTTTSTALDYNNGDTDINSLTSLGISVNNDGSLTFDANSLDSVLNSDYSSVVGFFQSANSWGQTFTNMLTNAGTSSPTGILALASSSNSTTESTLNTEISREQSLISVQQTSLTTELNSANEIMQELPTQLEGVNELYSAITGYNQNTNG